MEVAFLFFDNLLHKETIHDEWCYILLVLIYKYKRDVFVCSNYPGIKLMLHSMKMWEKVNERRLIEESEVSQNQFGFMPGPETIDAVFAIRQLFASLYSVTYFDNSAGYSRNRQARRREISKAYYVICDREKLYTHSPNYLSQFRDLASNSNYRTYNLSNFGSVFKITVWFWYPDRLPYMA